MPVEAGPARFRALSAKPRSDVFQVDIIPAAKIGKGIFLDHATGIVIGETAVIEDDVSMLQDVTLGGTGKEVGDRHPKIRHGVLIGAGAKVLGNIEVGHCARVAAGSVVLQPVPPQHDGGGRARASRRRCRLRRTGAHDGPDSGGRKGARNLSAGLTVIAISGNGSQVARGARTREPGELIFG